MRCEIVTVGTELLLGFTVDTNASEMGRMLSAAGIEVARRTSVGDTAAEVADAVGAALERSGTVIVSGGLGPTRDDVTKSAVAGLFGRSLERHSEWHAHLEEIYRRRGIEMPAANSNQADLPGGSVLLNNPIGTAPGIWLEDGARLVVMLPGVPKEMRGLMEREVVPRLASRGNGVAGAERVIVSRTLRTTGISESALADVFGDYQRLIGEKVTLAFMPTLAGSDLRFTAWHLAPVEANAALSRAIDALRPRIEPHVYAEGETDLAEVVLTALGAAGARLAVAESCTGGLLGARLTAIPGSSKVFAGGVVAYDDSAKLSHLGVSADVIAAYGAVSEPVARAMAEGASRAFDAAAAIAITGIAGPGGGSDEKPVGTVWAAVRWNDETRAFNWIFPGDREDVRHRAAQWALDRLRRAMSGS